MTEDIGKVGYGVFNGYNWITEIYISKGISEIDFYAFKNCYNLTLVEVEEGAATGFGYNAFASCSNLKTVILSSNVGHIIGSFAGCSSLEYTIYENGMYLGNNSNKYIALVGLVDYNVTELTIHSDTQTVDGEILNNNITILRVPASIKYIQTFNIRTINSSATIYYSGSETEWKNISFGNNQNGLLNFKNIVYNSRW